MNAPCPYCFQDLSFAGAETTRCGNCGSWVNTAGAYFHPEPIPKPSKKEKKGRGKNDP